MASVRLNFDKLSGTYKILFPLIGFYYNWFIVLNLFYSKSQESQEDI